MLAEVSSPPSPLSVGSDLSLTCSISLNSEVPTDGRLEVMWTLPNNSIIIAATSGTSATLTGSGTSYNSTLTVTEISTSDAGNYTCSARITSSNPFVISSISTMGAALVVIAGKYMYMLLFVSSVQQP